MKLDVLEKVPPQFVKIETSSNVQIHLMAWAVDVCKPCHTYSHRLQLSWSIFSFEVENFCRFLSTSSSLVLGIHGFS